MAIEYNRSSYTTPRGFLMFPDHYVCVPQIFAFGDLSARLIDGRLVIPAGTIWPANDATAIGIVFNDVDITRGDVNGALMLHGFVNTAKLPSVPAAAAIGALNNIKFFPLVTPVVTITTTEFKDDAADVTKDDLIDIVVAIDGATFRPEAELLTSWTFVGEAVAGVAAESIEVSEGGKFATITFKAGAAPAAGAITVIPKALATSTGGVPAAALTVITLS